MRDDIPLASVGARLTRCLHWDGRGAIIGQCMSPHTDFFFIHVHEHGHCGHRLSITVNRYCRLLDEGNSAKGYIMAPIDVCCIKTPLHESWINLRSKYWMTNLDSKTRTCQAHRDLTDHPADRSVTYVCVVPSDQVP